MRLRLAELALLIGASGLSACSTWQGPALYAPSENVDPFPHGLYRFVDDGKPSDARWDGTRFIEVGKEARPDDKDIPDLVIVPLALPGHDLHLIQATSHSTSDGQKKPDSEFFLVRRNGPQFLLVMPDCATSMKIVRGAGGVVVRLPNKTVSNPSGLVCRFTTRVSLEAAARRYAIQSKLPGVPFTRVGD